MNILNFILPPILGGIIALSTNWLAIKMLFRPHTAKYIFGVRIPFTPGLIPKERTRLAEKLSEAISTRLLTPEVLAEGLADPILWPLPDITIGEALTAWGIESPGTYTTPIAQRIKTIADKLLPKALESISELEASLPELDAKLAELTYTIMDQNLSSFAKMFISKEKVYAGIKNNVFTYLSDPQNYDFIQEKIHSGIDSLFYHQVTQDAITGKLYAINIKDALGAFLAKEKHAVARVLAMISSYIAKNMPIQDMILNKLNGFEVSEVEDVIMSVAGRELRLIIWLGGILGFIIGGLSLLL